MIISLQTCACSSAWIHARRSDCLLTAAHHAAERAVGREFESPQARLFMETTHITHGLHMAGRSIRVAIRGVHKYPGNAKAICRAIINDCWNGRFFQVSTGNFQQFWIRDFGMQAGSLVKMGHGDKVRKSLDYALKCFQRSGRVATTCYGDHAHDFPCYAPDSLAFLLHSLRVAHYSLNDKEKVFLQKEVKKFITLVIDPSTKLVRKNAHFSSMKDQYIRSSSCYDNIMAAMVARDAKALWLDCDYVFPLKKFVRTFWTGAYFLDDLSGYDYVAGDANVYPFWSGIVASKIMMESAIASIHKARLDVPFPLRYSAKPAPQKRITLSFLTPNYEGNTIWTLLGGCYLHILKDADKKSFNIAMQHYASHIQQHKNFLEVFHPDGSPYASLFYYADEGMLWAVNYLALL